MEFCPIYQDIDTSSAGDHAVRLADIFSHDATFFDHGTGTPIALSRTYEIFARGTFRAKTIRPHVLYTDCDMQIIADLRVKSPYHPYFCLAMLTGGTWSSRVESKLSYAPNSDVPCLITTSEPIEFTTDQTAGQIGRMVGLCIGPAFFEALERDDDGRSLHTLTKLVTPGVTYREFGNCEALKGTLRRLYQNPYRGALSDLYAESLALSAILQLGDHVDIRSGRTMWKDRPHRERAIEARRMIDQDLGNTPSIAAIADSFGIGETTLRRAFKAEFGTTIFEYLRDQRLEAARVMLREKRLRISEIAFRVGYSDPANFTNAYKQRFGHAPKREI